MSQSYMYELCTGNRTGRRPALLLGLKANSRYEFLSVERKGKAGSKISALNARLRPSAGGKIKSNHRHLKTTGKRKERAHLGLD